MPREKELNLEKFGEELNTEEHGTNKQTKMWKEGENFNLITGKYEKKNTWEIQQ